MPFSGKLHRLCSRFHQEFDKLHRDMCYITGSCTVDFLRFFGQDSLKLKRDRVAVKAGHIINFI